MLIFTLFMQVYIVSGGRDRSSGSTVVISSTETLVKDGGSTWQLVANLPSGRHGVRGVGLDHGRFMVTGECWTMLCTFLHLTSDAMQVASMLTTTTYLTWLSTTLKRTRGPQ